MPIHSYSYSVVTDSEECWEENADNNVYYSATLVWVPQSRILPLYQIMDISKFCGGSMFLVSGHKANTKPKVGQWC